MVVLNICYFHHYLGKIPILTNIFQRGWNQITIFLPTILGVRNMFGSLFPNFASKIRKQI